MRSWFIILALVFLSACQSSPGEWMFERAIDLWKEKKYEESTQNFVALITAYPEDPLVDDSLFWIASIYEHYLLNPEEAIRYYRLLNKSQKDSEHNKDALIALARIYGSQEVEGKKKALEIRKKLTQTKLSRAEKDQNLMEIAGLFTALKQYDKTRVVAKQLILSTKQTRHKAKAYSLIGLSYEREGLSELAELTYLEAERIFVQKRESLTSAISLAELYEKTDKLEKAIAVYQTIQKRLNPKEVLYQLAVDRIKKLETRKKKTQKG